MISKKARDDDGIDLNLDIPDLPDDVNLFKWQIPNSTGYEWVDYKNLSKTPKTPKIKKLNLASDDEGFFSTKCSPSLNKKEKIVENKNDEFWDKVLKLSISDYIDWDMREEYAYFLDKKSSF